MVVELETRDVQPQDSLRLVKLPNILGVEARPFDPDTFDAGAEVEVDERGFKRVRLSDQNCIRCGGNDGGDRGGQLGLCDDDEWELLSSDLHALLQRDVWDKQRNV